MTRSPTLADRARPIATTPREAGALARGVASLARRLLLGRLERLEHGRLCLQDGADVRRFGGPTDRCPLEATIHVRDPGFYAEAVFGGSVGAGESYMAGDWTTDDLPAAMRILLANRRVLDELDGGVSHGAALARRVLHAAARNTREGSRRNIAAHYDLGNDFFERLLDASMTYSCAVFEHPGQSLESAQVAKIDRICRGLELRPDDHLLEIGTGWGALAMHAARHYGCRVTTTTISREQHALARERIAAAGLADRVTLLLQDYRDLAGRYDKLVSIEMIEAVGHHYFDIFFRRCAELLAPGGAMLLQAITIDDRHYASARDSVDFIKRHIFPGCCIPSVSALAVAATKAPLAVVGLEEIGPHYATTLAIWRRNLLANADDLRARGYPEPLLRMFEFYLAYCEGGFAERALGDAQILLRRRDD